VVAPAAVADIACAAASFAAGLLDPEERSEEDADEEVGACAGEASSWNGFRIKGCGGGGVTGAAAAVPWPGAREAQPQPSGAHGGGAQPVLGAGLAVLNQ
jgi:hypothetical protein